MKRFVVIWVNAESGEWGADYVLAENEEAAEKWVEEHRDVSDTQAYSPDGL
jgi:hypothetical protein